MNKMKMKTTTILLIAILMISVFAVGVQAMHFLGMRGSGLSVTSLDMSGKTPEEAFYAEPETLVLDDVAFDAQSDTVTIEGTLSELDLGAGWPVSWPDTAYVEIGVRPSATKYLKNSGVYMIFFASGNSYVVHLQDYTGHGNSLSFTASPDLAPFTYEITLNPNSDTGIGGTADLVLYDKNEDEVGTSTVEYGYASTWQENVAGELDEDFSEAYLFYSIIADRRGVAGEIYSATIGDITTNIPLPHKEDFVPGKGKGLYKPLPNDNFAKGRQQEDFYVVAELYGPVVLADVKGVQKFDQEGLLYDDEHVEIGTIVLDVSITNVYEAIRGGYARASVHFIMDFYTRTDIRGTIVGKIWFDESGVQHVEGNFVGRGSHVKGTVELLEPDVLLFEGMEW